VKEERTKRCKSHSKLKQFW